MIDFTRLWRIIDLVYSTDDSQPKKIRGASDSMSEEFDPYFQWLGIRGEERPPNYYHLLGLAPGERDSSAIAAAFEKTSEKVKLFLRSRHAKRAEVLLKEVDVARGVLLDPAAKAQYDRQLAAGAADPAGKSAAKPPGKPVAAPPRSTHNAPRQAPPAGKRTKAARAAPPPQSTPPAAARRARAAAPAKPAEEAPFALVTEESSGGGSLHLRQPRRQGNKALPWILGGAAAAVLLVVVVVIARSGGEATDPGDQVALGPEAGLPTVETPPEMPEPDQPSEMELEEGIDWGTLPSGAEIPGRNTDEETPPPLTPETESEGVQDPAIPAVWESELPRGEQAERPQALAEVQEATSNALRAAYAALGNRNLEQARRELATAREGARGEIDQREVMRLETTVLLLTRFWDAIAQQLAALQPGDTLVYGGRLYDGPSVTFVGQGGGMLRLRDANGWERDFDVHPARIDVAIALGLAERGLQNSGGAGLAAEGAFLALDREGDPATADRAWELASAQAWPIEPLTPMAQYDYALLSVGVPFRHVGEVAIDDPLAGGPPWETPSGDELLPARRELLATYSEELEEATSRAAKSQLAGRLMAAGRGSQTPAGRYAAYYEAQRLAIEATDAEQLFAVIDVLAAEFDIEAEQEKLRTLAQITRARLTGEEAAAVMSFLEREIDRLARAEQFDQALSIAGAAEAFANRRGGADGRAIAERLGMRQRWLRRLKEEQTAANEARERLTRFPEDPTANETLGWYMCVFLGDWERGAQALAKSDDPEKRQPAELEVQQPSDPRTRLDLAKEWLELAERYSGDEEVRQVLQSRAATWLSMAIPELPENLKVEAEALLTQVNRERVGAENSPGGELVANLLGSRWQVTFAPNPQSNHPVAGGFRYNFFEFFEDGTCRNNRYAGTWSLQDGVVLVLYPQKPSKREIITMTAQGLVVDHYDPADTLVVRGIGTVLPP